MRIVKGLTAALLIIIICLFSFMLLYPENVYNYYLDYHRGKAGLVLKEAVIGDHKIKYLERESSGETLVLLHGFGADKDNWNMLAAFMPGYHIVIPDLPGFGDSTVIMSAKYDVNTQVERLDVFFSSLGLKKFYLAGNSMGGNISGIYAANHPDKIKGLILLNNSGVIPPRPGEIWKGIEKGDNPLIVADAAGYSRLLKGIFVKLLKTRI